MPTYNGQEQLINILKDCELQRWEFQSPRRRLLERMRKWVALISLTFVAAMFWGAVAAGLLKLLLSLSEGQTLIVFASAAAIVIAFLYFNRHKLARAAGFDD